MSRLLELSESLVDYCRRIKSYVPRLADLYRKNKIEEASEQMIHLIEGIEWMISASLILENEVDFDKDILTEISRKICKSFENKDYVKLADIIEYDFIPISDNIEKKYSEYISNSMN